MITHFNPKGNLIVVESFDDLGYSPLDGVAITTVRAAIGEEQGYTRKVSRIAALGFVIPDFHVDVFDLAVGHDIDGLIGLSFLRRFDYEIRSLAGKITLRPAVPDALPT
jgi:hypothetical protein